MRNRIVMFMTIQLCSVAWGQTPGIPPKGAQPAGPQSMAGMSGHDMSSMQVHIKDMPVGAEKEGDQPADSDASARVMRSMEGHMDMGPHMKMTALRQRKPGDAARALEVAEQARKASQKYTDYHTALADGYKIFHPEVAQKMYHFTHYGYAMEAAFRFNAQHPTSLLYEKHGDDYRLIGVMYTAPQRFTENQLDERIPLSVAQWHEHVNFCAPSADRRKEMLTPHPLFGLQGSITTQEACRAAGGTFHPVIFNWMVHIYPFEKDTEKIWSVERPQGDAD
jgi:hypothetical protein